MVLYKTVVDKQFDVLRKRVSQGYLVKQRDKRVFRKYVLQKKYGREVHKTRTIFINQSRKVGGF